MTSLACATCFKFFRVKKMGVAFEEGMPLGRPDDDGQYAEWRGYKLWMADLCECPTCGARILLVGPGQQPISEHYLPDYAALRDLFQPIGRVDDCGGTKP